MSQARQLGRTRRNFSRVMDRDRGICQYCGYEADCVDHVSPFSYFCDNGMGSLVAACTPCNLTAHALVFAGFPEKREFIRRRRGLGQLREPLMIAAPQAGPPLSPLVTVQDAIWGEPPDESGLPELVDPPDGPCGAPTKKGRPCRIPIWDCLIHPH